MKRSPHRDAELWLQIKAGGKMLKPLVLGYSFMGFGMTGNSLELRSISSKQFAREP
jgi:hypothetical protein